MNFHPFDIMGRGSEVQLQVDGNLFSKCSALKAKR